MDLRLLAEGADPLRPVRFVLRQQTLIEHQQDRFVLTRCLAKEFLDGGIVVLLLREDRDQHIGTAANVVGTGPVDAGIAVDIGSVEDQQIGRSLVALANEQPVEALFDQRLLRPGPLAEYEAGKDRLQVVRLAEAPRHQAGRVLGPGGQRTRRTRPKSREVIEHHALPDVRPAHDRHDQIRLIRQLRHQLASQQLVPLPPDQRGHPRITAPRIERSNRPRQLLNRVGTGFKVSGHGRRIRSREWGGMVCPPARSVSKGLS